MPRITNGQGIIVTDSQGRRHRKIATSAPRMGADFLIVDACRPEEWDTAETDGRPPRSVPWPVEDVEPVEE